jgi:radical SAM-linked protein
MNNLGQLAQRSAVIFSKTGTAIYHSHHDLIRFWERAVRRANLPVRLTQGFNPRPRLVFPHALGLGISSLSEELDLEFHQPVELPVLESSLAGVMLPGIGITGVVALPLEGRGRQIKESRYRVTGWPAGSDLALATAVRQLLDQAEISVTRGAPGEERRLDIRPFVSNLAVSGGEVGLVMTLRHQAGGSARPDELLALLATTLGINHHQLGVEKTWMRVE